MSDDSFTPDDRIKSALRAMIREMFPQNNFRGIFEYTVSSQTDFKVDAYPVATNLGLPNLTNLPMRPASGGGRGIWPPGSALLVAFVNGDPARPVVIQGDPTHDPDEMQLGGGGLATTEHLMTTEATALLMYNTFVSLFLLLGPGPLTISPASQAFLGPAVLAALAAQSVPAPPGLVAQIALAAAQLPGFSTGITPATTSQYFAAAIAALGIKTSDVSGFFPSVGVPNVKSG